MQKLFRIVSSVLVFSNIPILQNHWTCLSAWPLNSDLTQWTRFSITRYYFTEDLKAYGA